MNKMQLENELATSARLPLSTAVKAIDGLLRIVTEKLASGEEVSIRGFGTLTVVQRNERMGRNLKTGEEMLIPAHRVVMFKTGQSLKETINK